MAMMYVCQSCMKASRFRQPESGRTKETRCTVCHESAECLQVDSASQRLQAPRPAGPDVPVDNGADARDVEFPKQKTPTPPKEQQHLAQPSPKTSEKAVTAAILNAAHFAAKARGAQRATYSEIADKILKKALPLAARGETEYVLSGAECAVCGSDVLDELTRRGFSFAEESSQEGPIKITIKW